MHSTEIINYTVTEHKRKEDAEEWMDKKVTDTVTKSLK
jgi:hypothetical protein